MPLQDSHTGGCIGIEGRVDIEYPPVVGRHELFRDNETTAESTNSSEDRAQSVCLGWCQDGEDYEYGDPDLVHQKESDEENSVRQKVVPLVDQDKCNGGADREGKRAHSSHAYEDLEDEFMGE